jgi:hypothetical protein
MSHPDVLEIDYPTPLVPHETWAVVDSTKLKCYKACPRRFFYEYILGWRPESPNIHLNFGQAIHSIFEYIYQRPNNEWRGYPTTVLTEAFQQFLIQYREVYPDVEMDAKNEPKGPHGAARLMEEYATKYKDDDFEVLYNEVAGTVPIDDKHDMVFKMDLIFRDENGIRGRDFKTSSADRDMYQRKFHLDTQMMCYSHALHMLFPDDEVGMALDFLIPLKTIVKLRRRDIPVTEEQLLYWLWETRCDLAELDLDFELLAKAKQDDLYMRAFRRCDQNCTAYNQLCPYFDYCTLPSFLNPLQRCEKPQPGFVVSYWDPRALVEEAQHRVVDGRIE